MVFFNSAANVWYLYINGNYIASAAQSFGSWEPQFVAATIDFDADSHRLYVNDEAVISSAVAVSPPLLSTPFVVGSQYHNWNQVNGLVDDFVVYPRILSADEIAAIYQRGVPLQPPTSANMRVRVGEWTSTDWDGDVKADTAGWVTGWDLVDTFGIPFGAKAVDIYLLIKDAANTDTFYLRKDAAHSTVIAQYIQVAGVWIGSTGKVPVANGRTIDYAIASVGDSMEVYIRIVAVYL